MHRKTGQNDAEHSRDEAYLNLIHQALRVCLDYKPRLGYGRRAGVTLEEFQRLYQQDPFYSWFGLDAPLVYAAHKAAGGMTSVYRQIGIGCQRVFQRILQDSLGLTQEEANWKYEVPSTTAKSRSLSLDGRIPLAAVKSAHQSSLLRAWVEQACTLAKVDKRIKRRLEGVVFEVRQGYKSKDSKRQNADVSNAANAYAHAYIPTVVLLSTQIDGDVAERYVRAQWVMLRGTTTGTTLDSTYVFTREILGYDLAGFFQRHSQTIKAETHGVFESLLR